ncbi:Hypothetical predicted protein [Octopus vulgaris]|uniref:Uncharacterized protein n=1 Tax=Octopus vulgaris TaxID=6645 RepID=A0AA36F9M4_OCTVU|nr:Hypothetical predicted protein [Octopus vulgaris]
MIIGKTREERKFIESTETEILKTNLNRVSHICCRSRPKDKYLLISMVMLSTVCAWHGLVTLLDHDKENADRVEIIILSVLSIVYISYNVGFVIIIHMYPCHKRRTMQQKDKEYKLLQLNWIAYTKCKKTGRTLNEHQQQVLIGTPSHEK